MWSDPHLLRERRARKWRERGVIFNVGVARTPSPFETAFGHLSMRARLASGAAAGQGPGSPGSAYFWTSSELISMRISSPTGPPTGMPQSERLKEPFSWKPTLCLLARGSLRLPM